MFDATQMLDVDALEAYITSNKEVLVAETEDDNFSIDLTGMMIKGPGATQPSKYK
jgi:hypothetical protein